MRMWFAIVVAVLLPLNAVAQIAMTRARIPLAFTAITTAGGATTSTASGDDATQDAIPLGFTFNYLGTNYTTVSVSTNGWMSFAASAGVFSRDNLALFNANAPNLTVAPWWDDLSTTTTANTAHIQYQTSGAVGSRVFTLQWTSLSYVSNATRVIRFQVKLVETTNVIELQYDPTVVGVASTIESASIGREASGMFLDAATGSSRFGFGFMNMDKWPTLGFRFTPGAPPVLASGSYLVGSGGDFVNLSEMVAALNQRGIDGPVEILLTDALYDNTPAGGSNVFPLVLGPVTGTSNSSRIAITKLGAGRAVLRFAGSGEGFITANADPALVNVNNEPLLMLLGTDYVYASKLDIGSNGGARLDRGLMLSNITPTDGANFNIIEDIKIRLSTSNATSIGIDQATLVTPSAVAGTNSSNGYYDLDIAEAANGLRLLGNATFPDNVAIVGASPPNRSLIGSLVSPGLQSTGASVGVAATNQSSLTLSRTDIRNVVGGNASSAGIALNGMRGTSNVSHNRVVGVRVTDTGTTQTSDGIRAQVGSGSGQQIRLFNNFVSDITHGYTGAATTTRLIRGIVAQPAGGGAPTQTITIDHNNVAIDASGTPNASSAAYEVGTTSGPVIHTRSNVFANFSAAQTAPAAHHAYVSPSATLTGNTGSQSNNNDLYIENPTRGFVGLGNATLYPTLVEWRNAMLQDLDSLSLDPGYVDRQLDLHASNAALLQAGFTPTNITNDFDFTTRPPLPSIGADEFELPIDIFEDSFE